MSAPLITTGEALPLFTPAWGDVLQLRTQQVEWHKHDAAADDRRGTHALATAAIDDMRLAQSMLHGDPARLSPQEQLVLRRRMVRSLAMGFAAIDTLDRALAGERS